MTGPVNSTTDRWGNRAYTWNGEEFESVTTILKGIPKEALIGWAANVTADAAIEAAKTGALEKLIEQDEAGARKFLTQARFTKRDDAADAGSLIHRAIEAHILGAEAPVVPITLRASMDTFHQFEAEYQPVWEASEATVYNRTDGWAGTLDAICVIGGRRIILDVKSGKNAYPEHAVQLNAYARGEFIGLPDGTEHPMPELDGAAVLHLRPRGFKLIDIPLDDRVYGVLRTAADMREWLRVTSKTALGVEIPADGRRLAEHGIERFGDTKGEAA